MSSRLPDHLDLIADAPSGMQKLRGLILELAVRGKLVPQDPKDEPASELLQRIAKERARLEAEGTCKKSKSMPDTDSDAKPFDVPAGWQWVRLAEIGHDWGQKTPDADFTYVDVSAIDNAKGAIKSPSVLAPADAPSRARKIVCLGTVIYSTIRPYLLNIAVIDRELMPTPIASTAFAVIHPLAELSSQYIFWYLRSPVFIRYVEAVQMGIAYPAINDSQFFSGFFPLAPLAEQHRIVAKVDELMALCDRLEAEQTDATSAHAKLVETLLGTLTQSRNAFELAANWQRLSQHFDTLFSTESSLDSLKQTVLQLAVMGKLVPQDPKDEPANELLKRIAARKSRLAVEGSYKGGTTVTAISSDDAPAATPMNWCWVPFGEVMISRDNERIPVSKDERNTRAKIYDYYGASGVIDKIDSYLFDSALLLIGEDGANLINRSTPIAFIARGQYWVNNHAHVLDGISEEFLRFIELYINATDLKPYVTGTAQPKMNQAKMNSIPIALPPEAEQHRIVAKVDELMALCDLLKADLAESRTRQARLSTTLIDAALKAA
jgi:type I restriction enzyme S subunit